MSLPWLSDPRRPLTSPREIPKLEAWFDALDPVSMLTGAGATITDGGVVALWSDKSGNSGVNCLVLPGAASNSATTPHAAAFNVTDLDVRWHGRLNDYTPSATQGLISKWTAGNASFQFRVSTLGLLQLVVSADGTAATVISSTAATGVSDYAAKHFRGTLDVDNGAGGYTATFYISDNGTNWTQLGDPVVGGSTTSIFNGTRLIDVGGNDAATYMAGVTYSVKLMANIGGSAVLDINFSTSAKKLANNDTFVCATGQTVTLKSSGATGARIAGERDYFQGTLASRGTYNAAGRYIATDGTDDYYKTPLYNLPQPVTLYAVLEQSSWTSGDYLFDGSASDTLALIQTTSTPQINLSAGSSVAANTDLATATKALVTIVSNGASSLVSINRLAATTGNAGAGVPNGLTLASKGTAGSYGNARFYEIAVYRAAHDQATRHRFARYVGKKWGFAV